MQALLNAAGVIIAVGLCGASFTFGVAAVGRWMKWAPINIIVNVTRSDDA